MSEAPEERPYELVPQRSSAERCEPWIEQDHDALLALDAAGKVCSLNSAAARLFGSTREELLGTRLGTPLAAATGTELVLHHAGQGSVTLELVPLGDSAARRWLRLRDITSLAQARDELASLRDRATLFECATSDGLWHWDLSADRAHFSARWRELLGLAHERLDDSIGEWLDRIHPEDLERVQAELRVHIAGATELYECEHRLQYHGGGWRWVLCRGKASRDAQGRALQFAGSLSDITHLKLAEEQLAHRSFYDTLTELPNRALFHDRLRHALRRGARRAARRSDYVFAVLLLDLDRFKVINESLGHFAGDRLLVMIARRLELSLRPGDTVARLGGDEFAILLDDIGDASDAVKVADRVHGELSAPFNIGGHELFVSSSIGIATSLTGYHRPEDVLRDADTAMYRAKASGRARHALFDSAMHAHAVQQLQIERDLRRAIERHEMRVHYQPIVSLATGTIGGFEALVRWTHSERGPISPADFIPIAEETGLIVPLGRWVLRQACMELATWQRKLGNPRACTLSVNLSSKQLNQPDLAHQIAQILVETGVKGEDLQLEITESAILEHPDAAKSILLKLKELGLKLSIDDFGTGYSSLSYLQRFPIDSLKIDRSFVQHLGSERGEHSDDARIARTIVMIGRNLGKSVVAEGVETAAQLSLMRAVECDHAQGYFFSKAVDGDAAMALMAAGRRW
ncbi:MAG: EAL domain-containing protein [Planctomycetes bacterium]|nr:EAL domain-containing protein [Planctomycetota bacterium]